MTEGVYRARIVGDTIYGLDSGAEHKVIIKRKYFGGYSVTPVKAVHYEELVELLPSPLNYATVFAITQDWNLMEEIEAPF